MVRGSRVQLSPLQPLCHRCYLPWWYEDCFCSGMIQYSEIGGQPGHHAHFLLQQGTGAQCAQNGIFWKKLISQLFVQNIIYINAVMIYLVVGQEKWPFWAIFRPFLGHFGHFLTIFQDFLSIFHHFWSVHLVFIFLVLFGPFG